MAKRFVMLVCAASVGLLCMAMPSAHAQDFPVPACTEQQLVQLRTVLPEYVEGYRDISDRIDPIGVEGFAAHTNEADELIGDMHELQLQWWREGEKQILDCALTADISMTLGRLLDETLISFLCFSMQIMRHSQTGTLTRCLDSPVIWHGWRGSSIPMPPCDCLFTKKPDFRLRDPAVFSEDGEVYLLYSVAGEQGIAMTRPKK